MLTSQQISQLNTFGFLVFPALFSHEETDNIVGAFDEVMAIDQNGEGFPGRKRQAVVGFVAQNSGLFWLLEDDRIYMPMEQLLGSDFAWLGSDGNLYVGDTEWHPDSGTFEHSSIKVVLYLDPVTKDTGCLRVIPGSHLPGFGDLLRDTLKRDPSTRALADSPYGLKGGEVPSVPLESQPGDVVMFDQRLFHASYGGSAGRRMFTLNFTRKPETPADHNYLISTYERNLVDAREMGLTARDRVYTDEFLQSESPRVRSIIAEMLVLGYK